MSSLFKNLQESVYTTHFPGGQEKVQISSLTDKIKTLPYMCQPRRDWLIPILNFSFEDKFLSSDQWHFFF